VNRIETVHIDTLVPYWRNPRKNDTAVEKVKESIREYGYQSPIVVDEKMTIIAGHTRYRALKELGFEEIPVLVSDMDPKKAKEYRIIDNRAAEYATWTDDLSLELKEFRSLEIRDVFFPEVQLDPQFSDTVSNISQDAIDAVGARLEEDFQNASNQRQAAEKMDLPCPYCNETITLMKADILKKANWSNSNG
jgi:hypothetical protein